MRRFLLILLAILLLMLSVSYSEAPTIFEYRNGIHFGDSIDEVFSKEVEGLFTKSSSHIFAKNITLSGIPKSALVYVFTNNKLNGIRIVYSENGTIQTGDYETIESGLDIKYGMANFDKNTMIRSRGFALDEYMNSDKFYIIGISQRKLEYEDFLIIIDHMIVENEKNHYIEHRLEYIVNSNNEVIKDL